MKWQLAVAILALITAACVTSGTVDTSHKDIGGTTMHLTEWRDIRPYELRINVVDAAIGTSIHKAQQRTRDNSMLHQKAWFDRGVIFIERLVSPFGHYDDLTVRRTKSEAASKVETRQAFGGRSLVYEDSVRVEQSGRRMGWVHLVRDPDDGERTCIYASMIIMSSGKFLQEGTPGETYDTAIQMRNCSMASPFTKVVDFLSNVKVVKPEYNRAGGI